MWSLARLSTTSVNAGMLSSVTGQGIHPPPWVNSLAADIEGALLPVQRLRPHLSTDRNR